MEEIEALLPEHVFSDPGVRARMEEALKLSRGRQGSPGKTGAELIELARERRGMDSLSS
jgi:hypothetical protein